MVRICFKVAPEVNFIKKETEYMAIKVKEDYNITDKRRSEIANVFRKGIAKKLKCSTDKIQEITLDEYLDKRSENQ